MDNQKQSSTLRIVKIFLRLMQGEALSYEQLQEEYPKSLRTLQRDLTEIRTALMEITPNKTLPRNPDSQGRFQLKNNGHADGGVAAALAIANIVLASRSFVSSEKETLIAYLMEPLDYSERERFKQYLIFPAGSYTPVASARPLLENLSRLAQLIVAHRHITFAYQSDGMAHSQLQHGQPLTIYFDEMYFYVVMQSDEHQGFWPYRVDDILRINASHRGQEVVHRRHFSMQGMREQSYHLSLTPARTIAFRYWGDPQKDLDQFPNARIVSRDAENCCVTIRAHVRFEGVKTWLLSQGPDLELISPSDLVADLREILKQTENRYDA